MTREEKKQTGDGILTDGTKTLPSAGTGVELEETFNVADRGPGHCAKTSLKSLERLLPVCEEAEEEEKRGDWELFLEWLRVFLKMATNGKDSDWPGGGAGAHSRPLAEYENWGK